MTRYYLDITPTLLTHNGEMVKLGTVRYEVDKTEVGEVWPGQKSWIRSPLDGGWPKSDIQIEVQLTEVARAPVAIAPVDRPTPQT